MLADCLAINVTPTDFFIILFDMCNVDESTKVTLTFWDVIEVIVHLSTLFIFIDFLFVLFLIYLFQN